jgi:hypothetical protein
MERPTDHERYGEPRDRSERDDELVPGETYDADDPSRVAQREGEPGSDASDDEEPEALDPAGPDPTGIVYRSGS